MLWPHPCPQTPRRSSKTRREALPFRGAGVTSGTICSGWSLSMPLIFTLIWNALLIAQWIVLAQALMSWLINFQVLNIRQPLVYKLWSFLGRILEPVYAPIRRMLPSMSGVDFSPLVVLIGIMVLKQLLLRNQMAFY